MDDELKLMPAASDRRSRREIQHREDQFRLGRHVLAGTTDRADGALRNSASAYTDEELLRLERENIFHSLPLLAGLSRDVPDVGDKMIFDAAGPSIVIVRAADRTLRAYLNMCTHRAAELVTTCERSKRMTCPFHGWTFSLEGKLIAFGEPENFGEIDKNDYGLIRVPIAEWNGMIFVVARPGGENIDIEKYLGSIAPGLLNFDFADSDKAKGGRLDAQANWKYCFDTFGEGYHLTALHPETVGTIALTNRLIYDDHNPHYRIVFGLRDPKPITAPDQREGLDYSEVYYLFPNTILQVQDIGPGLTYVFYRIFPGDNPNSSFSLLDVYRSAENPPERTLEQFEIAYDTQVRVVGTEDYGVARSAQRNLRYAPDDFHMVYGANEIAIQNFQMRIAELVGRATGAGGDLTEGTLRMDWLR